MQHTEQLAGLIHKKHAVLVQLRDAGRRQTELIEVGEIGSLLTLLAAKQQLIVALQSLEQELKPFYAEDPARRAWRSPQERAACAQQVAECNAFLAEIVRLEQQGADKMAIRRHDVAEQLHHVHAASEVRSAYESHRR